MSSKVAADWQKTPEKVKHLLKALVVRIEQLERQCEELKAENQLHRTGGKKRGGQPGHEGHERSLYPIEACETVDDYRPPGCWRCGGGLHGDDPQPHRVQIVELPEVVPVIHVPPLSSTRVWPVRCLDSCLVRRDY